MPWLDLFKIIATCGSVAAVIAGVLIYLHEISTRNTKKREQFISSFDTLVAQLTSDNRTAQLSAAILLRRYFKDTNNEVGLSLRKETINVISSLLKTLPTSVFQKTLADGLAYAVDLSKCDLQKTNLQDVLLDNKYKDVIMNETDLFLADLSYANLEGIKAQGVIFYRAILFCTRIRNCDLTNADFRGADLTGVVFKNCILKGADFTGAINVPPAISEVLVDGKYTSYGPVTAKHESNGKAIFFSMPGVMSKDDELMTKDFKQMMEGKGYEVIYYKSDDYPRFGQFNKVRHDIMRSCGMIAFGLKQLNIHKASYRPGTEDQQEWEEKWLSTPWNEIEVGMGLMRGIPILLVKDPAISNGVFDKGLSECFVASISTTEDCRDLEQSKDFENWFTKL
jgi:uncharacterized protein YjbI with pentapeptide repeats